jgi:hypothetical protein
MSQQRGQLASAGPEVLIDKSMVFDVYGAALVDSNRVRYPQSSAEFTDLGESIQNLRDRAPDTAIVLVDGAFDVPQPNHDWYLRHCRLLGAKLLLDKLDMPVNPFSLRDAVVSPAVSLVVTVDADAKLHAKKSALPEKGGIQRPVYPWRLRAERIAGLTFEIDGQITNVVDLVTVEGDPNHVGTPLESSLTLASFMSRCGLLDGLVVYGEHKETIVDSFSSGINTLVIPNQTNYAVNPSDGSAWSSSSIIHRVQGK